MILFAIVAFVSIIQSIFGIGVLFFGTPLLLIYGLAFSEVLKILLPVSIAISGLQVIQNNKWLDFGIIRLFTIVSIPFCILTLSLTLIMSSVNQFNNYIKICVGIFLILNTVTIISSNVSRLLFKFYRNEVAFLAIIGSVHGLTNLGGVLLTSFVQSKYSESNRIRTNVAALYLIFASIQLITIGVIDHSIPKNYGVIIEGVICYIIANQIFKRLGSGYIKILNIFGGICGILVIINGIK